MGKDGGFMTAKAISKRIKARGLGRLRWYCQMCEKQCRDEIGFKCHTQSAGHQRQLAIFGENPTQFISKFSISFRIEFLSVLRQRYGTNMVNANSVYQEYIKDRDHVHMNATQWTTLSDFAKYLGKDGFCKVEDRDDGFWISFVDREVAEKDKIARERDTKLLEEEHRAERILKHQIDAATARSQLTQNDRDDGHQSDNPDNQAKQQTGRLQMKISRRNHRSRFAFGHPSSDENPLHAISKHSSAPIVNLAPKRERAKSVWQDAVASETKQAYYDGVQVEQPSFQISHEEAEAPWVHKDIFVKVKNGEVGNGSFRGKKGRVVDVIDEFGARVSMLDSDAVLELDQDDLETVIPKPGGVVLLLRGSRRGQKAVIRNVNVDDFNVTVSLLDTGEELGAVEYEMVSRV